MDLTDTQLSHEDPVALKPSQVVVVFYTTALTYWAWRKIDVIFFFWFLLLLPDHSAFLLLACSKFAGQVSDPPLFSPSLADLQAPLSFLED